MAGFTLTQLLAKRRAGIITPSVLKVGTVCPGSSDPFYMSKLLYKMGHYFLDTQYISIFGGYIQYVQEVNCQFYSLY